MTMIRMLAVMLLLSGCAATLDELEQEAHETGDWTKYDQALEREIERREAVEEWNARPCKGRVCLERCVDTGIVTIPGDTGRPREWRCDK